MPRKDPVPPAALNLGKHVEILNFSSEGTISVEHGLKTEDITTNFYRVDVNPNEPFEPDWKYNNSDPENIIDVDAPFEMDIKVVIFA